MTGPMPEGLAQPIKQRLAHVVTVLHGFLMPILRPGTPSPRTWQPGGPWNPTA